MADDKDKIEKTTKVQLIIISVLLVFTLMLAGLSLLSSSEDEAEYYDEDSVEEIF